MLGNNETIQGVDLAVVFESMLRDLPWNSFRDYVQTSPQIVKRCTAGGHRLERKHRKRFEKLTLKEAAKAEFSQTFCSPAFAQWYPTHEALHKSIEDYFHSDEYKAYRDEHELTEDDYVLPDEVFDRVFDVKALPQWLILLCFSPLQMTADQAQRVLNDTQGSEELLRQAETLKEQTGKLEQQLAALTNENEVLRARLKELSAEDSASRQEHKQLRADLAAFQKRYEAAQAENKRLKEDVEHKEGAIVQHQEKADDHITKEATRFRRDLERYQRDLESWQSKYEAQRIANRQLGQHLKETEEALRHEKNVARTSLNQAEASRSFANAILETVDWPEIGARLHLPPQLKRKFNSLVKKLDYDENRNLTLGGTLPDFWSKLQDQERRLVDAIAESDVREVEAGEVEAYWRNLTDSFEDVYIGLEARAILLRMLQEIFYQTLEPADLEKGKLPVGGKSRRD